MKGKQIYMGKEIVEMKHIYKLFDNNIVLKDVNISINIGEISAILGENAAGKSTLVKILAGIYRKDSGSIYFQGKEVNILNPKDSNDLGIRMVCDEPQLIDNFTVAQNIFLGNEIIYKTIPLIDSKLTLKKATEILNSIQCNIDVRKKVKNLTCAQKMMVEVARAIYLKAKVIILDEPNLTFNENEMNNIFSITRNLIKLNVAVIIISHKIDKVLNNANQVIIMRDGEIIEANQSPSLSQVNNILKSMAGEDYLNRYPKTKAKKGEVVFEVQKLYNDMQTVKNVNLTIRRGEIVGLAGLQGTGKTSLARLITGAEKKASGKILIYGKQVDLKSPSHAIKNGITYLSSDFNQNVFISECAPINIVISKMKKVSKFSFIDKSEVIKITREYIRRLNIKINSLQEPLKNLSTGTIKKIEISKLLFTDSRIFVLDDPSVNLDIASKVELYNIINKLANLGNSILLISSDLTELIGMSDRIYVMQNGSIASELNGCDANSEKLLYIAVGFQKGQ